MLKRILPILLAAAVLLTACGGTPTPLPVSAADIQNTAVAAAQTIVALTSAAQPTATPIPPTDVPSPTPLPTFTPEVLLLPPTVADFPTLAPTPTTAAQTAGECSGPINMGEAGFKHRVRIENTTKAPITVSLSLWKKNPFGQCGIIGVVLQKNQSTVLEIPQGNWWAGAYVNGPQPSMPNGVSFFIGDSKSKDLLRLVVSKEKLVWVGP